MVQAKSSLYRVTIAVFRELRKVPLRQWRRRTHHDKEPNFRNSLPYLEISSYDSFARSDPRGASENGIEETGFDSAEIEETGGFPAV